MKRTLVPILVVVLAACGTDDDAGDDDAGDDGALTSATEAATTGDSTTVVATTTSAPATTAATTTTSTTAPAPTDLDVGAWRGPYDVGVTTVVLDDDPDRPLTTEIWFPIDDATDLAPYRYTFLPEVYYESPDAFAAPADRVSTEGPFPLVVYSHGSGGVRFIDANYTEALASNGYVVAAPDHTGNTAVERILGTSVDFQRNGYDRPTDVSRVIDALTDPDDPATGPYAVAVDPERVAVTGHSAGGYTTYAMLTGVTTDAGTFVADDRVDAIIPLAPASSGIPDEQLASIATPALVIAGTNDTTTPIDPNVTRPWELSNSAPHYRVDLVDAAHQSFTDLCAYQQAIPTLEQPAPQPIVDVIDAMAVAGCSPGDMPVERVQDLTNTFAVAFLASVFAGEEMIDPDLVTVPSDMRYLVKNR